MESVQDITSRKPRLPTGRVVSGSVPEPVVDGTTIALTPAISSQAGAANNSLATLQSNDIAPFEDGIPRNIQMFTVTVGVSEPIIPNSAVPIYRISALLDGALSVEEVMQDFPSLTADQILMAREYALKYPNYGVPHPKQSLKRLLRESGFVALERKSRKKKRALK
jgi:uncharacterized protein (DUF433 family)